MAKYLITFEFQGPDGRLKKSTLWADMPTLSQRHLEEFTTKVANASPMIDAVLITFIKKMDDGESAAADEINALISRANSLKAPPKWLTEGLERALLELG